MGLLSTQEFIKRSKAIHGDKYDYSVMSYKGLKYPINLICKKHNYEFTVKAACQHIYDHYQGCQICKAENLQNHFFNKAKTIHGDKYDYSKSVFVSSKKPIDIICKKHSYKFTLIMAQAHVGVAKQGCPICSAEKRELQAEIAKKKREESEAKKKEREKKKALILANEKTIKIKKTKLEKFLKKARAKYGDTYDYSLVDYKGREIPINVICKIHGVFPITPRNFLAAIISLPTDALNAMVL